MAMTILPHSPPMVHPDALRRRCAVVVASSLAPTVRDVLQRLHCDIEACDCREPTLNCDCSDPLCVIVDGGSACGTEALLHRAHERWPGAVLIAVSPYWSEDEPHLRALASTVLHLPVRESEWTHKLSGLMVPVPAAR